MAQVLANAHIEHLINGHRVRGLADEERPIEFPGDQDMADLQVGQDGGLYGMTSPMFGGEIIYRVEPTSPTAQWAVQQKQLWKDAVQGGKALTIYNATHANSVAGWSASLDGGILLRCPDIVEAGQTFEFVIRYEQITSNVDGGIFSEPLSSPA